MASAEALLIQHSSAGGSSTPFHRLDRPDGIATQLPMTREGNIPGSSSSGASLSRLLSIRQKQSSTPSDHLRAITVVRSEEVVVSEPSPPVSCVAAPSDTADASIRIAFPADSARAASQSHSSIDLDRSRSLLSTSMPSLGCSSTRRRRRQQSPSVSGQPKGTLPSTKSIHDSTSALHALDLNKSNAYMSSASASRKFPSFFMKGLRHTRARTEGAQLDLTEQIPSYRMAGWRSRKISLSGINLLKTPLHAASAPSTPEIETWKQKEAVQRKTEEASLHYISRGNEAEFRRRESSADMEEIQYTTNTSPPADQDKIGPICDSGYLSTGPVCAVKSSQTRGKRRKPMTPLDLSAIAAAEATLDSPLPSFHDNYRPYSLISTDLEGNETPIVRLQKLIVDTNEGEDDHEEQSRLFFRPVQAEDACFRSSETTSPEGEVVQDQHDTNAYPDRSNVGLFLAEQSDPCSGSDTLLTRRLSSQKHGERDDSQLSASARRILKFYQMGFDDDNQLQYQQRQPSRLPSTSRVRPSGTATSLMSAPLSIEIKRESVVSSRSDSSVNEAVLSRATSTRLQSVPLRRIRREDLAHQPAQDDKKVEDVKDSNERGMNDYFDGLLPISGVATSSKSHIGSQPSSGLDSKAEVSYGKEAISGQQTFSKGITTGISPSKHSRAEQGAAKADSEPGKAARGDAVETQRMEKDNEGVRKKQGRHATRRRSRGEEVTGKEEKHRRRHSRQSSQKKSYLTSEAAATAKRKEQEDREERSRQRRQRKELARQEAYAEKKRNDPLLKMRLALVGLATADESEQVQTSREICEELQPVQQSIDSTPMRSKASFHTAEEEEEEEEMADGLALSKSAREVISSNIDAIKHPQQAQRRSLVTVELAVSAP